MDIEKLIEQLRSYTYWLGQDGPESHDIHPIICDDAAIALSTLQAENEKLKGQLYDGEGVNLVNYWMQQAKIEENGHRNCQAENEKLRALVDGWKKKYVEANGKWIAAENKWDGLDKAVRNGSVYRPIQEELNLTHEENQSLKDANEKLRAGLEQVKREKDAAVSWAQKYTESIDRPCVACKHNTGDYVCTAICGNCGPMGAESCKWEFDFSGELKED